MMPVQKPGKSKQDYGTPQALIDAVEKRWGRLEVDLAATADNAKAERFIDPETDSLTQNWRELILAFSYTGIGWLNPPFADIEPWAAKCAAEKRGASIIMLTPASIGAEWFAKHVENAAAIVALRPRLTFEGCTTPYPKDCILTLWGPKFDEEPIFRTWRWK